MDRYDIDKNVLYKNIPESNETGYWVKYDDAITELEELMKELTYKKGAYKDVYSGNATPNQLKADAIQEMVNACGYGYIDNGSFVCHHINLSDITRYINKLEDK